MRRVTCGGLSHYKSLFPDTFVNKQLANLDEHGVVKPGVILQPGDPFILATRPKTVSSTSQALGRLSKTMRLARRDASQVWDGAEPALVLDVADTKTGKKVVLQSALGRLGVFLVDPQDSGR